MSNAAVIPTAGAGVQALVLAPCRAISTHALHRCWSLTSTNAASLPMLLCRWCERSARVVVKMRRHQALVLSRAGAEC
jgi:phage portal protein BeeE